MKFRVLVQIEGKDEPHWEDYEKDTDDPKAWARDTVAWFNRNRHPWESPRRVVKVEVLDRFSVKDHNWKKQNLSTLSNAHGFYDRVKCSRCGVRANRYEFSRIIYQRPFKRVAFQRCDTALAHMQDKPDHERRDK